MSRRTIHRSSLFVFVALPLIAPSVLRAADKSALTFELFADRGMEFRWRLKQGDDILGTAGQGYKEKASCTKGIEGIKKGLADGKDTFEIYQDNAQAFRWRLKSSNGQVVAAATKGCKTKAECEEVTKLITKNAPNAAVVEEKK
jgi:uncharacterized protein YegP (UPF0339 family)